MLGTSAYIAWQPLKSITAELYVALERVLPPVPEWSLRPAAEVVFRLGDGRLLQLGLQYAHSTVARCATKALGRGGIGIGGDQ
jgi:hypothetical protein